MLLASPNAHAAARTPTISGNWFLAIVLAAAAVAIVGLLIAGAVMLERRDAWLGRGWD